MSHASDDSASTHDLQPALPPADRLPVRAPVRRRPPPPKPGFFASIPLTIRIAVPVVVLALVVPEILRAWSATRAGFSVAWPEGTRADGEALRVTVFPVDDAPWTESPKRALGGFEIRGAGPYAVPAELLPEEGVVRIEAEGQGTSWGFVERGGKWPRIPLSEPCSIPGRVLAPAEADPSRGVPVAGAKVLFLGGGLRGIPVGETVTDTEGRFLIAGVGIDMQTLHLRVLAPGFSVAEREIWLQDQLDGKVEPEPIQLRRTAPIRGRLVVEPGPGGEVPDGLRRGREIRVLRVAGISAKTDAEGRFVLEHMLPPPKVATLLVADLPEGWTHRKTRAPAGTSDVEIVVEPDVRVRGRVINGNNGVGVSGVNVFHYHGPRGVHLVKTSSAGWWSEAGMFEIDRVPRGEVQLVAELFLTREEVEMRRARGETPEGAVPEHGRLVAVRGGAKLDIGEDGTVRGKTVIELY